MSKYSKAYILLDLCKIKIAIPVALSCFTGYILHSQIFHINILFVITGIFLIVASASALNHIQEYKEDAKMRRTCTRPIPSGQITTKEALMWSLSLVLLGAPILLVGGNYKSLFLAFTAMLWYNGVYTPLKKLTAWAVLPGALCGAFPPLIGWIAAGGQWSHPTIICLSIFLFIGQIPHFWLLLLSHKKEYQRAGFKVLSDKLTDRQIIRLTLTWIVATTGVALLLPSFGVITSVALMICLVVISVWLLYRSYNNLKKTTSITSINTVFKQFNQFCMWVILIIIANQILPYIP